MRIHKNSHYQRYRLYYIFIKTTSGVCKSCCTTEAIQATLLALQSFIKCKRNNNNANSIHCRWKIGGWLLCSLVYSCLKLKPIHNLFDALFETRCCSVWVSNVRLCSIGTGDNFWVSSIKFDYRTQSRPQSNDWSSIRFDDRTFD